MIWRASFQQKKKELQFKEIEIHIWRKGIFKERQFHIPFSITKGVVVVISKKQIIFKGSKNINFVYFYIPK